MALLGWPVAETMACLAVEHDHDRRAALVCLLTAGLAKAGRASAVGEPEGGWLWLPPLALWAPWAGAALATALAGARAGGHLGARVLEAACGPG